MKEGIKECLVWGGMALLIIGTSLYLCAPETITGTGDCYDERNHKIVGLECETGHPQRPYVFGSVALGLVGAIFIMVGACAKKE